MQAQADQMQRLQAMHEAEAAAHRRDLLAVQQREAQRTQDIAHFFGSLNIPGVVVPPSLLTPFVPPVTPTTETPVSIYGCLYFFNFYGCPPGANEFASPLCTHSRRVRHRLLKLAFLRTLCTSLVALLRSLGGSPVALLRPMGGQVTLLCSQGTPGGHLDLRRLGGKVGKVVLRAGRGTRGKVGVLHNLSTKVSSDDRLRFVMDL